MSSSRIPLTWCSRKGNSRLTQATSQRILSKNSPVPFWSSYKVCFHFDEYRVKTHMLPPPLQKLVERACSPKNFPFQVGEKLISIGSKFKSYLYIVHIYTYISIGWSLSCLSCLSCLLFVCLFLCLFVCLVLLCFVLLYFSCFFWDSGKVPNLFAPLASATRHWAKREKICGSQKRHLSTHLDGWTEVAPVSCVHPLIFDDIYNWYLEW